MAETERADLVIIGAGPAGLAAAERAVALGARPVLVESGEIGGVSANWGTLPAQALAHAAERAHQIRAAKSLGLGQIEPRVNFARINSRIRETIAEASVDISPERLAGSGIELVRGKAKFVAKDAIAVEGRTITAKGFVVATGSRPLVPDVPGLETAPYFTPETIFEITRKPEHLVVVGGGGTGLALAQSHRRLGCKVTVIDMVEPLADSDGELAEAVLRRLRAEGLDIIANTGVVAIAAHGEEIEIALKSGPEESRLSASHILFATGRRALLDELGLEMAKVKLERGRPILGANGRSTNPRLYIVGDAAGAASTHAARHGGQSAAAALLGAAGRETIVPRIIHTRPGLVEIGMTEAQARGKWDERIAVTRAGFAHTDAARAAAEPNGHIKMITRPGGAIVGVGMVGPAAPELAPFFGLAIGLGLTPHDLGGTLAPHPTFGEAVSILAETYARHHPQSGMRRLAGSLRSLGLARRTR